MSVQLVNNKKYIISIYKHLYNSLDFSGSSQRIQKKRRTSTKRHSVFYWTFNYLYSRWYCESIFRREKIYEIYDNKNHTVESWKQEFKKLINWTISNLSDTIVEIRNMWNTLNNHLWWISNYFKSRHTNSIAEWLNSRIRRVLNNSRWFRNYDYMVYRILRLFW